MFKIKFIILGLSFGTPATSASTGLGGLGSFGFGSTTSTQSVGFGFGSTSTATTTTSLLGMQIISFIMSMIKVLSITLFSY